MGKDAKSQNMKPGIYKAISFPVWSSDMFSCNIFIDAVEIQKSVVMEKFGYEGHTNQICECCYRKWTDSKWFSLENKQRQLKLLDKKGRDAFYRVMKKEKMNSKCVTEIYLPVFKTIKRRLRLALSAQRKIESELKNI